MGFGPNRRGRRSFDPSFVERLFGVEKEFEVVLEPGQGRLRAKLYALNAVLSETWTRRVLGMCEFG